MQRKVLAFLVMSGALMIGYLLAIAGPNPPWPVLGSARDDGNIYNSNERRYGGTIWANVYVAYNLTWINENRYYRTYHWAQAYKWSAEKMKFKYEWKHDGLSSPLPGEEEFPVDTSNSWWEADMSFSSIANRSFKPHPYTAIRSVIGDPDPNDNIRGEVLAGLNLDL
ncbi:hypothetical protein J7M22_17905 [Candidatus Poribacteria bacterium]|nr:hypothetical protein [Candidatus Poribacteria bacterium]